jgi:glucose-1-phosphatase
MSRTPTITPRVAVFDLGKVLLDFDYHRVAEALSRRSDLSPVEVKAIIDQTPLLHRYESGGMTTEAFFEEVRRQIQYRGDFEEFSVVFGDIFAEIPEMVALHRSLRERSIPTFVFSNTNALAIAQVRLKFPFFSAFDGYVLSYEVGAMKPAAPIYEAVESLTGVNGPELLYIDDRPENIEAAVLRGWHAVLHTSSELTHAAVRRAFGWQ